MILSIRSAGIQSGKQAAAFAWAVKVAAHINATVPGINVRASREVGGHVAVVHWISEYASLADFETKWAKLEADPGYQAHLKDARDAMYFDAASIHDHLYQTVG
jgi:hypothetical protein